MKINQSNTNDEKANAKRINQCKNDEDIQEYFEREDTKLWKSHGFVFGEMREMWVYFRDRQELLSKCGDRMRVLKTRNVHNASSGGEE